MQTRWPCPLCPPVHPPPPLLSVHLPLPVSVWLAPHLLAAPPSSHHPQRALSFPDLGGPCPLSMLLAGRELAGQEWGSFLEPWGPAFSPPALQTVVYCVQAQAPQLSPRERPSSLVGHRPEGMRAPRRSWQWGQGRGRGRTWSRTASPPAVPATPLGLPRSVSLTVGSWGHPPRS